MQTLGRSRSVTMSYYPSEIPNRLSITVFKQVLPAFHFDELVTLLACGLQDN